MVVIEVCTRPTREHTALGTDEVLCVGAISTATDASFMCLEGRVEAAVIRQCWDLYERCQHDGMRIVGFGLFEDALPLLVHRSWRLGLSIPRSVVDLSTRPPRWNPLFIDLREVWQLGTRRKASWNAMALAMETGRRSFDPATFYKTWDTNRNLAMKRLKTTVRQPAEWCRLIKLEEMKGKT